MKPLIIIKSALVFSEFEDVLNKVLCLCKGYQVFCLAIFIYHVKCYIQTATTIYGLDLDLLSSQFCFNLNYACLSSLYRSLK